MNITQTEDEILSVLDEAQENTSSGKSKYSGMSYEDGVIAALDWILGRSDVQPMED